MLCSFPQTARLHEASGTLLQSTSTCAQVYGVVVVVVVVLVQTAPHLVAMSVHAAGNGHSKFTALRSQSKRAFKTGHTEAGTVPVMPVFFSSLCSTP